MKRVTAEWHPDTTIMTLRRHRDVRLASSALLAGAETNPEAKDLLDRRFPTLLDQGELGADAEFVFYRHETHVVIDTLTKHIGTLGQHPILRMRAGSLIGQLVAEADTQLAYL